MSNASRTPTPEHAVARDIKPTQSAPTTLTKGDKGVKGGKAKTKASPRRKTPSSSNSADSASDDKKPDLESNDDSAGGSPAKRSKSETATKTKGKSASSVPDAETRVAMLDEIISVGMATITKKGLMAKYGIPEGQLRNMMCKGKPGNWRAKALNAMAGKS